MGKKISAKALASLYPSTQWRTRNVINSATTKVQKAYDDEFTRLKSIQQTYKSVMDFAGKAAEGFKSFKQAKLAGYDGKMLDYAKLDSVTQGNFEDRYKKYNKDVMDKSNGTLTLDKLYKETRKNNKNFKLDKFSEKMRMQDEDGTEDYGLNVLMDAYTQSQKEAPGLSGKPARPDIPISEDESFEDDKTLESISLKDYRDKSDPLEDEFYSDWAKETSLQAQEDDVEANEEYWNNAQEFVNNENYDFDFSNPEDRLEWMDKLGSLSKEERFKVYQDIQTSEDKQARIEERKGMAGEEDVYAPEIDEMYDVLQKTEKSPGIRGFMQRMLPGGKSGYDTDTEFTTPHGDVSQLPPPFELDTYEYTSRPTRPEIPVSEDEDFGEIPMPSNILEKIEPISLQDMQYKLEQERSWPTEQQPEGPPVPYPEQLGPGFFNRRINVTPYEIPSSFGIEDKPLVSKGLTPSLGGFQRQYQEQIRKRKELEDLYR